ncbi:MAG: EpsG family protein [Chryseobacterium sp.]|nr:EpsG family protein [Chryseobacterium sp.]MCJ7933013.1 EpsG family protein [Chryseobacterium sp.]
MYLCRFYVSCNGKKEYKKYYIINIILLFFHNSSTILLLLPFLANFKLDRKGLMILIFSGITVMSVFTLFPGLVNFIALTESMSSKFANYSKYSLSVNGMIYNFIVFALFPYCLVVLNRKYFKELTFEKLIFPYFFIISIYIPYSGFGRLINYFGLFMLVFFVNTLYLVMHVKKFNKARFLMVFILTIGPLFYKYQFYSADTSKYYKNTQKANLWYPYSDIFDKTEYQFRQVIFQEGMNESAEKAKK